MGWKYCFNEFKIPDRWRNTMAWKKRDVMEGSEKYALMTRLV